jgi:drug/metabolite transporter (DMT)-like permease
MQLSQDIIIGISAGLMNASLYAASVVVYRSEGKEIGPISAAALKMWIAFALMTFIILLPFGYNPFTLSSEVIFLLILSIITNAVFGDCIYLISQERIGVAYAFPIVGLFPIFTYFIALAFLGEQLVLSRLLGTVIAVLGVAVLSWEQNKANITP